MNAVDKLASVDYDRDFYHWLCHQQDLLRQRRFEEIDLANLIEEIEDLGSELLHAVQSWTTQILVHLTCLTFALSSEPKRHWANEIRTFRGSLHARLESSPSLRNKLAQSYDKLWRRARRDASAKLRADGVLSLPEQCPFTLEQVLDEDYFACDPLGGPA